MRVVIKRSTREGKKLMAVFISKTTQYVVHFGAVGYEDYTTHGDKDRMMSYRSRHRNDNITQFDSPGALSWWILWNKPSIRESIRLYKKHFKLT